MTSHGSERHFLSLVNDLDNRLPDELDGFYHASDLTTSILIGDDATFEAELASTHDVNKSDSSGCTPLHYACFVGNTQYIEQLLDHGALPDAKDHNRWSPLHRAVQKDNYEAVDRLLSSGANQWASCKLQQTPLHVAATHNAVASATLLLQLSPEHLNKTDKQGSPALHHAAYYDNAAFVRLLLDYNADFTLRDREGRSAAHWAAIGGHEKIMIMLAESGADLTARDKRGRTPLHYAAFTSKTAAIDCLLRRTDQPIDARDNDGCTPLHYATHTGNIRAIRLLVDNGAPIDAEAADGTSVAHIAAAHTESSHALDYYLSLLTSASSASKAAAVRKALSARRLGGFTPLHLACEQGRISRVDALIKHGVDAQAKADGHILPLHVAARAGHQLVIKHLLREHGVDVNAQQRDGLTALHLSAYHSYVSNVKTLVECGADVHLTDGRKRTPLHLAAVSTIEHNEFCVETLLAAGAEVSPRDAQGLTPLHYAASKSSIHVVEKLLRANADTEALDAKRRNVLHLAVWRAKGCTPVIQALCRSNGRLLQRRDADGFYPIHYAASRGNSSLVQYLFDAMGTLDISSAQPFHLTPLHMAAAYDRLSVVRVLMAGLKTQASMVEQGTCTLADKIGLETDARLRIPMHYAMENGFLEVAKVLSLQKRSAKTQLGWTDKNGQTPLHLAAANRHTHCVQWAMAMTDVLTSKDSKMRTPAMLAITARLDAPTLALLIEKARLPGHSKDSAGRGFLHRAVFVRNRALIRTLLEAGCDANDADHAGVSLLHVAAAAGDPEIVQLLIKAGARVERKDAEGRLPADWAAACGQLETLEALAPSGAPTLPPLSPSSVRKMSRSRGEGDEEEQEDEDERDEADQSSSTAHDLDATREEGEGEEGKEGEGEGEVADRSGDSDDLLNESTASSERYAISIGRSPLPPAAATTPTTSRPSSRLQQQQHLLSPASAASAAGSPSGAMSPATAAASITPSAVLLAASRGHLACLAHLLSIDATLVQERDAAGRTPLHLAAAHARFDCVELLIEEGAAVEAVDYLGRTPLMLAAMKPRARAVVEHLLEQGAEIGRVDVDGNTVFHLVCAEKNEDAAKLLVGALRELETPEARAAVATVQNNKGETPLHLIVRNGLVGYYFEFVPYASSSFWTKDDNSRLPITSPIDDPDVAEVMHALVLEMFEGATATAAAAASAASLRSAGEGGSGPSSRKHSHSTQDGEESFY